jgi:hypothetical protein
MIVILDFATESHYHHPACEHVAAWPPGGVTTTMDFASM